VKRVIAAAGAFDLTAARKENLKDVAIVRIAQLYPFPHDEFRRIDLYSGATEVVCARKSRQPGAWHHPALCAAACARPDPGYAMRAPPLAGRAICRCTRTAESAGAAAFAWPPGGPLAKRRGPRPQEKEKC
jgi:hypothetical protein